MAHRGRVDVLAIAPPSVTEGEVPESPRPLSSGQLQGDCPPCNIGVMASVDEGRSEVQVRVVAVGAGASEYLSRLRGVLPFDSIRSAREVSAQAIDHDSRVRGFAFTPDDDGDVALRPRFLMVAAAGALDDEESTRLLENVDLITFVAAGDGEDGDRWEDVANRLRFFLLLRDVPTLVLLDRATAASDATLDTIRAECGLFHAPAAEIATHTGEGVREGFALGARLVTRLLTLEM